MFCPTWQKREYSRICFVRLNGGVFSGIPMAL